MFSGLSSALSRICATLVIVWVTVYQSIVHFLGTIVFFGLLFVYFTFIDRGGKGLADMFRNIGDFLSAYSCPRATFLGRSLPSRSRH